MPPLSYLHHGPQHPETHRGPVESPKRANENQPRDKTAHIHMRMQPDIYRRTEKANAHRRTQGERKRGSSHVLSVLCLVVLVRVRQQHRLSVILIQERGERRDTREYNIIESESEGVEKGGAAKARDEGVTVRKQDRGKVRKELYIAATHFTHTHAPSALTVSVSSR